MAKGTINWDNTETWQRLVASILATDIKIDLRATATFYGTTYDTLENRFRKLKKDAVTLKDEVKSGERGEVTAASRNKSAPTTPRKPKTPKKDPLETVTNGRVAKSTPSKKKNVKDEPMEDVDGGDMGNMGNLSGHQVGSFDQNNVPFGIDEDMFN